MRARRVQATVTRVSTLGPGLARVDMEGDGIGGGADPGRFAMVESPGRRDGILLRPYSYFLAPDPDHIALLVKDAGRGTHALLEVRPGTHAVVLGPLGNRFPEPTGRCWAVAGGVGAAPFGGMAARSKLRVIFGARTATEAGFARALNEVGVEVELATDDGSEGFRGSAVDCLRARLEHERPDVLLACGPTPMMRAAAAVAAEHEVPCWVSLEARMGCGFGVCRSCTHRDAGGDWRCICEDGPVYEAAEIFAPQRARS